MLKKLNPKRALVPLAAAAVTALGVGGIAIAQSGSPASAPSSQGEQSEAAEPAGGKQDREQQVTGPDATRAKQAALAKVGSGKVTDVSSEKADAGEAKDSGEATDPGEPAGEQAGEQAGEAQASDGPGGHADEAPASGSASGQ